MLKPIPLDYRIRTDESNIANIYRPPRPKDHEEGYAALSQCCMTTCLQAYKDADDGEKARMIKDAEATIVAKR